MTLDFHPAAADLRAAAQSGRAASRELAQSPAAQRDLALTAAAAALRARLAGILAANAADLEAYEGLPALRDRLRLDARRVEAMAAGLEEIAALPDPLGQVMAEWTRPNGLRFRRHLA